MPLKAIKQVIKKTSFLAFMFATAKFTAKMS